jgi:hypothetical protein
VDSASTLIRGRQVALQFSFNLRPLRAAPLPPETHCDGLKERMATLLTHFELALLKIPNTLKWGISAE